MASMHVTIPDHPKTALQHSPIPSLQLQHHMQTRPGLQAIPNHATPRDPSSRHLRHRTVARSTYSQPEIDRAQMSRQSSPTSQQHAPFTARPSAHLKNSSMSLSVFSNSASTNLAASRSRRPPRGPMQASALAMTDRHRSASSRDTASPGSPEGNSGWAMAGVTFTLVAHCSWSWPSSDELVSEAAWAVLGRGTVTWWDMTGHDDK
jgi:hypothetical protein